jgi:glyoxylase-like metal-dependent hydrolase (beta-lactamase superfamily II)
MVGIFQENAYLVRAGDGDEGLIVDPGDEADRILQAVRRTGLRPAAIVGTHGHLDHVGAAAELQEALGIPFRLHAEDEFYLATLADQARAFGLPPVRAPRVDAYLEDGEDLAIGADAVRVVHLPGHTPGGVGLYDGKVFIVGDTVFAGSVGRTDLPGGDWDVLRRTLRERLLVLPDATLLYPGHGPPTTMGAERGSNPFLIDL